MRANIEEYQDEIPIALIRFSVTNEEITTTMTNKKYKDLFGSDYTIIHNLKNHIKKELMTKNKKINNLENEDLNRIFSKDFSFLNSRYEITYYLHEIGLLDIYLVDVSRRSNLMNILSRLVQYNYYNFSYHEILKESIKLLDAKFAIMNEVVLNKDNAVCRLFVGADQDLDMIDQYLGRPLIGSLWPYKADLSNLKREFHILKFNSLHDLINIEEYNKQIDKFTEITKTSKAISLRVKDEEKLANDIIFLFDIEKTIDDEYIDQYIEVLGLLLSRYLAEKKYYEIKDQFVLEDKKSEKILDSLTEIVGYQKSDHTIISYNKVGRELLGVDSDQFNKIKCFEIIGQSQACEDCPAERAIKLDKPISREKYQETLGKWINTTSVPIKDTEGNIVSVVQLIKDITHRKEIELAQKESEEKYRLLVNQMVQPLALHKMIYDENGKAINYVFIDVNPSFEKLLGKSREEIVGKTVLDLLPDTEYYWIERYSQVVEKCEPLRYENYSVELDKYFEVVAYTPKKDHFAVIIDDVTDRIESRNNIIYLSNHDQLTGLYNRKFYEDYLEEICISKCLPLSLLNIDLNGLKLINDAFGHQFGDEILQEVAKTLSDCISKDHKVFRFGGDEFLIIMPNTDNIEAKEYYTKIKEHTKKKIIREIPISLSMGIATMTNSKQSFDDIYKVSEDKMYRNKLIESPKMHLNTISIIERKLHAKSPFEENHARKVAYITKQLSESLNLNSSEKEILENAALLHNIGKINFDVGVLNNKIKPNKSQLVHMERHSEIGYRILSSHNDYASIAQTVLEHHENYDGSGYPKGIEKDEICLFAKILRIADEYIWLIEKKPLGSNLKHEEAIRLIDKDNEIKFDPTIKEIFIKEVANKIDSKLLL
jgi:diguanylate cyclase (GGDEF)-like protein/PAS domain S-box-containing protein